MDTYQEHLDHSAPCSSRWDGFDRGDIGQGDAGVDYPTEKSVIGRMTNPFGQRVVVAEMEYDGAVCFSVAVDGEYTDWANERDEAIRLARLRMEVETAPCWKCNGDGKFYGRGGIENGVFKGFVGTCYGCNGKGVQTLADLKRNSNYWKYYARISG